MTVTDTSATDLANDLAKLPVIERRRKSLVQQTAPTLLHVLKEIA